MLCVLNGIAEYIVGAVLVADLGRLEYCLPFLSFFYIYIYVFFFLTWAFPKSLDTCY